MNVPLETSNSKVKRAVAANSLGTNHARGRPDVKWPDEQAPATFTTPVISGSESIM